MSIDDILQALTKENLAATAGLRSSATTTGDLVSAVSLFGTGMILGAGLALLFAPMAGHEVREGIADKVGELGDQFRAHSSHPTSANGPTT